MPIHACGGTLSLCSPCGICGLGRVLINVSFRELSGSRLARSGSTAYDPLRTSARFGIACLRYKFLSLGAFLCHPARREAMPWSSKSVIETRLQFVSLASSPSENIRALCGSPSSCTFPGIPSKLSSGLMRLRDGGTWPRSRRAQISILDLCRLSEPRTSPRTGLSAPNRIALTNMRERRWHQSGTWWRRISLV